MRLDCLIVRLLKFKRKPCTGHASIEFYTLWCYIENGGDLITCKAAEETKFYNTKLSLVIVAKIGKEFIEMEQVEGEFSFRSFVEVRDGDALQAIISFLCF